MRLPHSSGTLLGLLLLLGGAAFAQTTLTPATLAFGNEVVNVASAQKTATFKNTQTAPLTIASIAIGGTDPADYAFGGNCPLSPSTLVAGDSCSITVTFTPDLVGSRTAILTVTHSATTSPQSVFLTGTGEAPVTLSSATLNFGYAAVGNTSDARIVTLTNHENVTITFTKVATSTGYAVATNTCGASIAAGATCTVGVSFSPTATGAAYGTLTFTDNAANSPQTVSLTGEGTLPVTGADALNFGYQVVGTTSPAKTVTLTNRENVTLTFTQIATTAGFVAATNTCGASIAAGATCTVAVAFSPTATGAAEGTLTFTDGASNSPQTVNLTGEGVTPVALSVSTLAFGYSAVGNTSGAKTVTLTNHENVTLTFTKIATSAGYAVASNSCGASIAAGAACTVGVTFSPTATGAAYGTLTFTDNAANSPQTVSLSGSGSGTGVAPVTLSVSTLAFGYLAVGDTSAPQSVTLTNHENATLTFTRIATSAGYAVASNTCGTSLTAGASCTVGVTFSPTATGAAYGTLTFTDIAANSPRTVGLSGEGIIPATPSVNSLAFGSLAIGDTSAAETVTLTNHENVTLTFTKIAASAGYAVVSNTCGASIAAGAACAVGVTFSPTATGAAYGTLTFTDGASNSPQTVSLTGTGEAPVTLSSAALDFGYQVVGTTSAAKTITLTNYRNVILTFTKIATSAGYAVASNTCGASIAAGAGCMIGVTFSPTATGADPGTLTFTDNATNSPQTVGLSGERVTQVTLSVSSLAFGSLAFGDTSAAKTVTLTNHENVTLTFTKIATSAGYALASNTCGASIAAEATCTVGVTFSPTVAGADPGTLTFTDNAANSPQTVSLTGTGYPPVTVSPSSLTFGDYAAGTTSPAKNVALTNHLNTAVSISSVAATGDFTVSSNTCGSGVGAGLTCTVGVKFTPGALGTRSGTLAIGYGAFGSPIEVPLTGVRLPGFVLTGSMNTARAEQTATLLNNGTVLIAGGCCGEIGTALGTAELYRPATGTFTRTGNMQNSRSVHTATLLNNGMVLIAGGGLGSVEVYNPGTGAFTLTGSLNTARIAQTATLLNNGMVLIAGGSYTPDGFLEPQALASAELYNPSTGTFTFTGSLNKARYGHTATLLNNGMVLIAGGVGSSGLVASAELYNPATGSFTSTGSPNTGLFGHTATLLNNGMVLIAGGDNVFEGLTSGADLYNPATGTFTLTGSLNTDRFYHTATLLNNGTVLIAGGGYREGSLASTELYNPATGTFTLTGSLNTARDEHTATLLNNGMVLTAGGESVGVETSENLGILASAELYEPASSTPAGLLSISVSPANATLSPGSTQQFIATGTFSDTSPQQLASVTWSSSGTAVAEIGNDATNPGRALAEAAGNATITATAGTVSGSALLDVR